MYEMIVWLWRVYIFTVRAELGHLQSLVCVCVCVGSYSCPSVPPWFLSLLHLVVEAQARASACRLRGIGLWCVGNAWTFV
jgi:hypothetical protein